MMAAINTAGGNSSATAPTAVKSPRQAGDGVGSPQSRRAGGRAAAGASPWTQIVRGESEPIAAESAVSFGASASSSPPSSSSSSPPLPPPPPASSSPSLVEDLAGESSESGNAGKRLAWNKPSNGGSEVGPVMGAESWPALGESARVSTKSSSESLKGLSDSLSSISLSQVSGTTISTTTSPKKQAFTTTTPNQMAPVRPRSMRPRNNPNASSNGVLHLHQAPAGLVNENASSIPSPRDHTQRSGFGSHSHSGGEHPQQRNPYRNRNGGPHQRGDGSPHQNYGGRRDHERGNNDWNSHSRSLNGRESHMQPQRNMTRMFRGQTPPPSPGPFIPNHGMRPLAPHPMPFPGELGPPLVYISHPPFVAPIQSVYMPPPDPELPTKIVKQIEYYFSFGNLLHDTFLRKHMDDYGWVPVKLVAGFNEVKKLTTNIQFILEVMRMSDAVEVQGDKLRKRTDYRRWILHPSERTQFIEPEERNINFSGGVQSYQPQLPNGNAAAQFGVHIGADRSFSGRN